MIILCLLPFSGSFTGRFQAFFFIIFTATSNVPLHCVIFFDIWCFSTIIHPSIYLSSLGVVGVLEPIPAMLDMSPLHHIHTDGQFRDAIYVHVFGLWEKARIPKEKPCRRRENIQTPNRKESNPQPFVLTTAPLCRPAPITHKATYRSTETLNH